MNTPNRLTVLRMALIPVYLVLMYLPYGQGVLWAGLVFVTASLTDFLDGYIARRDGLVTDFGKLMDPLADKLLVMAALVVFVDRDFAPAWAVVAILGREFLVSLIRQVAAAQGSVIAADKLGKVKTVFQMSYLIAGMVYLWAVESFAVIDLSPLYMGCQVLCYVTVGLTLLSGANYTLRNKQLFLMR